MTVPESSGSLVVPIEIFALPVEVGGRSVAQVAHTFEIEQDPEVLWLGQNTEPTPFEPASSSLGPGVHLHWALPSALTRGRVTFTLDERAWSTLKAEGFVDPGKALHGHLRAASLWGTPHDAQAALEAQLRTCLQEFSPPGGSERLTADEIDALVIWISSAVPGQNTFPVVPNRWVITRRVVEGPPRPEGPVAARSWVVESDRLWDGGTDTAGEPDPCKAQNALSLAVPVLSDASADPATTPSFRYLGRVYDADGWKEGPDPHLPPHSPHTALGYGNVTFAAALPHCYNVFGLHDPLIEGSHRLRGPLTLEYSVVGWYANGHEDPVRSCATAEGIEDWAAELGWWWPPVATAAVPARTLLRGCVTSVPWSDRGPLEHASSEDDEPAVQVAIASSASEALSALWARQDTMADTGMERYLNVLQAGLLNRLETKAPGFLKEWDEALHRNDFAPVPGGTRWVVEDRSRPAAGTDSDSPRAVADGSLRQAAQQGDVLLAAEPGLDRLLHRLSTSQQDCDDRAAELAVLSSRLFGDWCNFLQVRHPPDDQMQRYGLLRTPAARALASAVDDRAAVATAMAGAIKQRNRDVLAVTERLAEMRERPGDKRLDYDLVRVAAPRFWQPQEPVVLIAGPDAERSASALPTRPDAPGGTSEVLCALLPETGDDVVRTAAKVAEKGGWSQKWAPPRRPLMLQWEVTFLTPDQLEGDDPAEDVGEDSDEEGTSETEVEIADDDSAGAGPPYGPRYLLANAHFDPHHTSELTFLPNLEEPDRYSGSVLLTGGADLNIVEQARLYLRNHPDAPDGVRADLTKLVEQPPRALLSQALSGFNAALLARRQSLQLPVLDPHERDPRFRKLGHDLRVAIGSRNDLATNESSMSPLRRGHCQLTRLWLLDSFGQVVVLIGDDTGVDDFEHRDLPSTQVIRSDRFIDPNAPDAIALRPRLVQPTRLMFRWRSATALRGIRGPAKHDVEMNSHPATSPVVGWVVANHLEDRLAVFDPTGAALGSISAHGRWQGAPGSNWDRRADQITPTPNAHLLAFVEALTGGSEASAPRLDARAFLDAVNDLSAHVMPHSHDQYDGVSLLMGRPLALVRASLELQMQGPPAVDPGWDAFRAWVGGGDRDTRDVENLQVPVRLGHKGHLDDGLIGLFAGPAREQTDYTTFLVEDHDGASASSVRAPRGEDLAVATGAGPRMVTLLVDPRAPVHAISGILPVKQIQLPPTWMAAALRRIAVTFPVVPTLQPKPVLALTGAEPPADDRPGVLPAACLPTPSEPGFTWSFVSHTEDGAWPTEVVAPVDDQADFSRHRPRLVDGWLELVPVSDESSTTAESPPEA